MLHCLMTLVPLSSVNLADFGILFASQFVLTTKDLLWYVFEWLFHFVYAFQMIAFDEVSSQTRTKGFMLMLKECL